MVQCGGIEEASRLSIDRCREVIGDGAVALTDNDVLMLRAFLYRLADIICGDIERTQGNRKEDEVCNAA